MINLKGKRYKSVATGEIFAVETNSDDIVYMKSDNDVIINITPKDLFNTEIFSAIDDYGYSVNKDEIMDEKSPIFETNQPSFQAPSLNEDSKIDAESFLKNNIMTTNLASQLKSVVEHIDPNTIRDDTRASLTINDEDDDSIVVNAVNNDMLEEIDLEKEKEEIAEKYKNVYSVPIKKNEVVINVDNNIENSVTSTSNINDNVKNNPIVDMFKSVKRTVDFSVELHISNKIPQPSFIKMWEENYNDSIIDYLTNNISQDLLNNPQQVKEIVKDGIMKVVYGKNYNKQPTGDIATKKKTTSKKRTTKKKTKKVVTENE